MTAATLTVTKVYDGGLTTAAVTTGTGLVSGDTVTVGYTATYIDANVGTGKPVTLTYTLSGTDAGNYTEPAGDANATGEITPILLTAKLTSITTEKVYNGNTDGKLNCYICK